MNSETILIGNVPKSPSASNEMPLDPNDEQRVVPSQSTKPKSKSCGDSPKVSSQGNSRNHSPSSHWKKSLRSSSPANELEREGGEEAPFARESAGGSGYSSPYSERATPPYLRWAKSLEDVLEDYEGMELFKQYLAAHKESHLLDFWYACKGFRQLKSTDTDRIRSVAVQIYTHYVNPKGISYVFSLSSETRNLIHTQLAASSNIDQSVYDSAHKDVEEHLRNRHAQFVTSDEYITYLQDIQVGGWDSPKCYSREVHSNNSSSSGDGRRLSSTLLPTVHEDAEFDAESEHLTAAVSSNVGGCTNTSDVKVFSTAETDVSGGVWVDKSSTAPESSLPQQDVLNATSATTGESSSTTGPNSGVTDSGTNKRRQMPTATCSAGSNQKAKPGPALTRDTLQATLGQRLLTKPFGRCIGPPHPYHAPYNPYLPTSAQDSELQSMSSDATTESGFSGANYQRKEHRIMQQHVEHNRHVANSQNIPRTVRPHSQAQNMLDVEFLVKVQGKLEQLRVEQERSEKIQECLKRLSEPENGHNDHRAALNKFYNEERNSRGQNEDIDTILEDYCSRVPDFKDSPKHSPLRSPGIFGGAGSGRRRSPVTAKSPIRAMMTSYPSGQSQMTSFSHTNSRPALDGSFSMSQSVIQPSRNKPSHSSAGNTIHRAPKHEQFMPAPSLDKRSVTTITKKPAPRYPVPASDTSGVYSGTSTEPSLVCTRLNSTAPSAFQKSTEQHWFFDRNVPEKSEDTIRHKTRAGNAVTATVTPSTSSETKSHKSSSHRGGDKATISTDKNRGQKAAPDDVVAQTSKNPASHVRRSDPAVLPGPSFCASGAVQEITVGIFLPNEKTPYLVRYPGRQITLKQFKPLVPRKGNFRYFFQCVSNELGTGTVQREIVEDHEILPFCDNKVVAKVVPYE